MKNTVVSFISFTILCYDMLSDFNMIFHCTSKAIRFVCYAKIGTKKLMIWYGMLWNLNKNASTYRGGPNISHIKPKTDPEYSWYDLQFFKYIPPRMTWFVIKDNILPCQIYIRNCVSLYVKYMLFRTQYKPNFHGKLW